MKAGKSRQDAQTDAFIKVHHAMMHELNLHNTSLLVFARIYGFCKNGGYYYESKEQAARFLNIARRSVFRAFKELLEMGLIEEVDLADIDLPSTPANDAKCYRLCTDNLPSRLKNPGCDKLSPETSVSLADKASAGDTCDVAHMLPSANAEHGLVPKQKNPRFQK